MQVPGSSIFYVGIRVVSLRGKSYCTSLFQKIAFFNNNNGNFICVFECTIVNLATYTVYVSPGKAINVLSTTSDNMKE